MNVNPFSYLIEKLKGKVDKSGDTMSGDLTLGKASTVLKIRGADKYTNITSDVTSSDKNISLPDASGTIALTVQPKTNVSMYGILCQKYYGKFVALFPLPNAENYTNITPLDMGMGYKYTDPTLTWGTVHKEGNLIRIDINSGASDEHVGSFVYGHFNLS